MCRIIEKNSYLGDKKCVYFERDCAGDYSYMDGEWIWIQKEL